MLAGVPSYKEIRALGMAILFGGSTPECGAPVAVRSPIVVGPDGEGHTRETLPRDHVLYQPQRTETGGQAHNGK